MEQMLYGKSRGKFFCRNVGGKCTNLKISSAELKIFYTGTREFDNVLVIYLSKIPIRY